MNTKEQFQNNSESIQERWLDFLTQDSNTPEEQPNFFKSTLADTDNLQVTPNDSTLGNTKFSSPEYLEKPDKNQ